MKINLNILSVFFVGLVLIGCSESDQINGQGLESYRKSVVSITKHLSQDERLLFMENIKLLNMEYGGYRSTVDEPDLQFLAYINGKSLSEINSESSKVKKRNEISSLRNSITQITRKISQLELDIAAKSEKIQTLQQSIEAAEIQIKSHENGAARAKEILDSLVIFEAKHHNPQANNQYPLWMGNFEKSRIDFKIINETKYLVDIENITITSDNGKIVLRGGFECEGLGNHLLGLSGKIQPRSEKKVQCEVRPDADIGNSATIGVSGGSVLGIGEYNPEAKSPLDSNNFVELMRTRNKNLLEETQAELDNMIALLPHHQASWTQMCHELIRLEKDGSFLAANCR